MLDGLVEVCPCGQENLMVAVVVVGPLVAHLVGPANPLVGGPMVAAAAGPVEHHCGLQNQLVVGLEVAQHGPANHLVGQVEAVEVVGLQLDLQLGPANPLVGLQVPPIAI